MLPAKRWAAPLVIAALIGIAFLAAPTRYAETLGQPVRYIFLVPIATALLAYPLWWSARARNASPADLASVTIVGLVSIPILGLTGFHGATMLLMPLVVASGAAWLAMVLLRRLGDEPTAHAVASSAFVLPIAILPTAMTAWLTQFGLGKFDAVALVLPAIAGVLALVVPRLPRKLAGPILATAVGCVGIVVMLMGSDARPYLPFLVPDSVEAWLGDWSTPPVVEEPEADPADVSYWEQSG